MPPRVTRSSSPSRLVPPQASSSVTSKEPVTERTIGATLVGALSDADEITAAAASVGLELSVPDGLTTANLSSKDAVTEEQMEALELMKLQLFQTLLSTNRIPYRVSESGVYQVTTSLPVSGETAPGPPPLGLAPLRAPATTPSVRAPLPKAKQPAVKLVKLPTISAVEEEAYNLFQEFGSWCSNNGRINPELLKRASGAEVVRFLEKKAKEEAVSFPSTQRLADPSTTSLNHSVQSPLDFGQHLFEADFAEPMARNTVREMQKVFFGSATFTSPVPPGYEYPAEYSCFQSAGRILAFVDQTNQAVSRHMSNDALLVSNWCNLSYSLKCLVGFKDLSPHAASYELLTQLKIVSKEAEERASAAVRMNAALKEQAKRITALGSQANLEVEGALPAVAEEPTGVGAEAGHQSANPELATSRLQELMSNPAKVHQHPLNQVYADSSNFVAGQVNASKVEFWEWASDFYPDKKLEIMCWIKDGVDVTKYMRRFKGATTDHRGATTNWDQPAPPLRHMENHPFKEHKEFVFQQICEEIANGTRLVIGVWDEVKRNPSACPTVISPLGVEPTKPRLFDNCAFLNHWFPPIPFRLPSPAITALWGAACAAITDLKAAFMNIRLHPSSRRFFGTRIRFPDGKWYVLVAQTLVFGWSMSPYVCQTLVECLIRAARSSGIPSAIYIDDAPIAARAPPSYWQFNDSVVVVVILFQSGGFCISLSKSDFRGNTTIKFLGILAEFDARQFRLPVRKVVKFWGEIRTTLEDTKVCAKTLMRFAGIVAHFAFVIQGALAFTREMVRCISQNEHSPFQAFPIDIYLSEELEQWIAFLAVDNVCPWLPPLHAGITFPVGESDASNHKWHGILEVAGFPTIRTGSDFDIEALAGSGQSITLRESLGLEGTLRNALPLAAARGAQRLVAFLPSQSMLDSLSPPNPIWEVSRARGLPSHFLEFRVDNMGVKLGLDKGSSRNKEINDSFKRIWLLCNHHGIVLVMKHVASELNRADAPSRAHWSLDRRIAPEALAKIISRWGTPVLDAMASPVNRIAGLPFISEYTCSHPDARANDILSWLPSIDWKVSHFGGYIYIFPPFPMIAVVWEHATSWNFPFVMVVPQELENWWPLLGTAAVDFFLLGEAGSLEVYWEYTPGQIQSVVPKRTRCKCCRSCQSQNLPTFKFCSACGVRNSMINGASRLLPLSPKRVASIQQTREGYKARFLLKKSQKAKSAVLGAFETFLARMSPPVDWRDASPDSVLDFLVHKRDSGRTQMHKPGCPHRSNATQAARVTRVCDGKQCGGGKGCPHNSPDGGAQECPTFMAAGSMQVTISQLREGFGAQGFSSPWNPSLSTGNPVRDPTVDAFLSLYGDDMRAAGVSPIQATPILPHEHSAVAGVISKKLQALRGVRSREVARDILVAQLDLAMWNVMGESGRRPGNIVGILPQAVLTLPDGEGCMVSMISHKTAAKTRFVDRWSMLKGEDPAAVTSAWKALVDLKIEARLQGWKIQNAPFLFPQMDTIPKVGELLSVGVLHPDLAVANARFKAYFEAAGLPPSRTLQGLRVADAVRSRVDEARVEAVRLKGGWASKSMADHYSVLAIAIEHVDSSRSDSSGVDPLEALARWIDTGVGRTFFQ
ncbi:hypothetical protein BDR26DRAFT_922423 [Obelidium mucronatum]|nr:hypothetical protein BDR26DRAFT_922423 [Obelidium mucronatum]